jgi:hypothetical protein
MLRQHKGFAKLLVMFPVAFAKLLVKFPVAFVNAAKPFVITVLKS